MSMTDETNNPLCTPPTSQQCPLFATGSSPLVHKVQRTPLAFIHTPKLNKILRPLRSKLACLHQTVSSVPTHRRSPCTPRSHHHTQQQQQQQKTVTYNLRRSSSDRNAVLSAFLPNYNHLPAVPTKIPSPLKLAIHSVYNAYQELVLRCWSTQRSNEPLSLFHLSAFAIGDLLALEYEHELLFDHINHIYQTGIPVSARSAVFLQHATRLILNNAMHDIHVMYQIIEIAYKHASPFQFFQIAKSIISDPMKLSLDHLTKISSLARKLNCIHTLMALFVGQICTPEHIERTTFLQFARWLLNSGNCVSASVLAMRILQIGFVQPATCQSLEIEYVRILIESVARLDFVHHMNEHMARAIMQLAMILRHHPSQRSINSMTVVLLLLVLYRHKVFLVDILIRDRAPLSMDLIYQYSPPTFWLEVALALHELGDHHHALQVVYELMNDVQDGGGEFRCGLSVDELSQWVDVIHEQQAGTSDESRRWSPNFDRKTLALSPTSYSFPVADTQSTPSKPVPSGTPSSNYLAPGPAHPTRSIHLSLDMCRNRDTSDEDELILGAPRPAEYPPSCTPTSPSSVLLLDAPLPVTDEIDELFAYV